MSQQFSKVSDSFWPSLKKKLEQNSNNFGRLDVQCQICFESTTVGGPPYSNVDPQRDHRASILACGHIFGDKCIAKYLKKCEKKEERVPNCPTCRATLQHAECSHACLGIPVPNYSSQLCTVLPTLTEDGKIADLCSMCELSEVVECLIHEIILTTPAPADHFICAIAHLPDERLWVKPFESEIRPGSEAEWQIQMSETLKELLRESEKRLRQKHLYEWSTGSLAGLKLELHFYTNEEA
ncbi:RING-type domain-containing protein [Fusarium sp. LHS14.1]|nr:RING-type domain-containing protein [Fusarium sp. LHS14.1]